MLKIGETFDSYADFLVKLEHYKKFNFYDFSTSDCRTLNAARVKYPKKLEFTPECLKYYFLKLKCIHGGIFKKSKISEDLRATS